MRYLKPAYGVMIAALVMASACAGERDIAIVDVAGVQVTPRSTPNLAAEPVESEAEQSFADVEAVDTPPPDPALIDFAGSDAAFTVAAGLRDRLVLQLGCEPSTPTTPIEGVGGPTSEAVDAAIASVPSEGARQYLNEAFAAIDAADSVCNENNDAWAVETRRALQHLLQLEAALGTKPDAAVALGPLPAGLEDPTRLSADVAMVVDRVYAGLSRRNPVQSSNLWYSSAHMGHLRGVRMLLAEGKPLDGLIVGDSTAALGVGPHDLSRAVGARFANVAINGARLNVQIETTNQLLDAFETTMADAGPTSSIATIVWVVQTLSFIRFCPTSDQGIGEVLATQRAAFEPVDLLRQFDPIDRLLGGDLGNPHYRGTQLDEDATSQFATWDYGAKGAVTQPDPKIEARQGDAWASIFAAEEICRSELERMSGALDRWQQRGIDVVVVVPPISQDMAAASPRGWTIHEEAIAEISAITTNAGATMADASRSVGEENFRDLLHILEAGKPAMLDVIVPAVAAQISDQ